MSKTWPLGESTGCVRPTWPGTNQRAGMDAVRHMKRGKAVGQCTRVVCFNWNNWFSKFKGLCQTYLHIVTRQRTPIEKWVIKKLCWT